MTSQKPLRSQPTRDRILAAARRLFCDEGYERTTIRAVAAAADIDSSMVMRYYGSKEGLFAAAATFDLDFPDLTQVPRDQMGRTLVRHFLKRWEARDRDLPGLLRVCITHQDGRALLVAVFRKQIAPMIARITGPKDGAERAALIATQMLGLALTRYVLALPPVVSLSQDALVERIGATLQAYLTDGLTAPPRALKRASATAATSPAGSKSKAASKSAAKPAASTHGRGRRPGERRATPIG